MRATLPAVTLTEKPAMDLRIWDLCDNLDGNIERGLGGNSVVWPHALDQKTWSAAVQDQTDNMARLLKSTGLNGVVLNNVNACGQNTKLLWPASISNIAQTIYPVLTRWGLTVYFTPCYAAPMSPGMGLAPLKSVDPLDPKVIAWWANKSDEIARQMPSWGGFLVKADSEGNKGPIGYNRTEADGANMLARAVAQRRGDVAGLRIREWQNWTRRSSTTGTRHFYCA